MDTSHRHCLQNGTFLLAQSLHLHISIIIKNHHPITASPHISASNRILLTPTARKGTDSIHSCHLRRLAGTVSHSPLRWPCILPPPFLFSLAQAPVLGGRCSNRRPISALHDPKTAGTEPACIYKAQHRLACRLANSAAHDQSCAATDTSPLILFFRHFPRAHLIPVV